RRREAAENGGGAGYRGAVRAACVRGVSGGLGRRQTHAEKKVILHPHNLTDYVPVAPHGGQSVHLSDVERCDRGNTSAGTRSIRSPRTTDQEPPGVAPKSHATTRIIPRPRPPPLQEARPRHPRRRSTPA